MVWGFSFLREETRASGCLQNETKTGMSISVNSTRYMAFSSLCFQCLKTPFSKTLTLQMPAGNWVFAYDLSRSLKKDSSEPSTNTKHGLLKRITMVCVCSGCALGTHAHLDRPLQLPSEAASTQGRPDPVGPSPAAWAPQSLSAGAERPRVSQTPHLQCHVPAGASICQGSPLDPHDAL